MIDVPRTAFDVCHESVDVCPRETVDGVAVKLMISAVSSVRTLTVTGFVERGLAAFAERGIEVRRLMSDNAFVYRRNRSLRELLARNGIRHLLIPYRRPQVNGKVERYQQTLKREWALGQIYRSSDHRATALSHWLDYYNERRPHSSLGGLPPLSRVHNVCGQDN